jgi:hypothetical protein
MRAGKTSALALAKINPRYDGSCSIWLWTNEWVYHSVNYRALSRGSVQTTYLPKKGNCSEWQNRTRAKCNSVDCLSYCILLEVKMRCGNSDKSDETSNAVMLQCSVSQTSLLADPYWLQKMTSDHRSLLTLSIDCPDDRYPKLKMYSYISELILDSYQYIPVAYVTMHCITWP